MIQAIGNKLKEKYNVIYTTAKNFLEEYIKALSKNKANGFRKKYINADILLIDDIQIFQDKVGVTEEFGYIFDFLFYNNIQIVITCSKPPLELSRIIVKMLSLLKKGLCINIPAYDFKTKCEIIKNIAETKNIIIEKDKIENIVCNTGNNINEIHSELAIFKLKNDTKKYNMGYNV